MAMAIARRGLSLKLSVQRVIVMETQAWRASFFTYDKGKLFDDRERAFENVFIQKWERERLEKLKNMKIKMANQQEWLRQQEGAVKAPTASPELEKQPLLALG